MLPQDALTIEKIQAAMRSPASIPASDVRAWMPDASIEVLALLTRLVLKNSSQIEPPLAMEETCDLVRRYYQRALTQGTHSDFVPPRSVAGHELVRWFRSLWNDPAVPRKYLHDLKIMLAELYKSGDAQVSDTLVNAVFEHLFETPGIAEFFQDWRSDPVMANAFNRAMEWGEKSPKGE
jgi:hypothetical protein